MKWHKLFDLDLIHGPDFLRLVEVNGRKLCAVKVGENVFITQAYCPHAGAVLSGGWCKEGKLVCPHHRYEYDLYTGKGAPGQNDYLEVYSTEKRADGYYVALPERLGFLKKLFSRNN